MTNSFDCMEKPPSVLYKFSSFKGAKAILEGECLWTKSPLDFNDPFEVLPAFDEERKNEAISSWKSFCHQCGLPPQAGDLIRGGGEESTTVESWVDLAPKFTDPFFAKIYHRFRVLCFSKAKDPILMWSHYADSHKGIALGFDLSAGDFPRGRFAAGIPVAYIADRNQLKIPLDYYRHPGLDRVDPSPALGGYVKTSSGILIPKTDEEARHLDCLQTLLRHKYEAWCYEKEQRFLYDLTSPSMDGLRDSGPDTAGVKHQMAPFCPEAVSEIIFGYKCSLADITSILTLIQRLPKVRLFDVDLHPMEFKVRVFEAEINEIRAAHRVREQSSFRFRGRTG